MTTKMEAIRERAAEAKTLSMQYAMEPEELETSNDRAYLLRVVEAQRKHMKDCPMIGECIPSCGLAALLEEEE